MKNQNVFKIVLSDVFNDLIYKIYIVLS
jgi:hypothetical protein